MRNNRLLALMGTVLCACLGVSGQTKIDLATQGRNFDFSNAPSTSPFQVGTTLPATCKDGAAFFKSDEPPGLNLYLCTLGDVWTRIAGSGGNIVPGSVGGVVVTEVNGDIQLDVDTTFLSTQGGNNDLTGNNRIGLGFDHLSVNLPNNETSGTALYALAKLTGAPSTATTAATSDTAGVIGVVVSGAGTTGVARIAIRGRAQCVFDSATTAGDWVTMSTVTDGNCRDAGATEPTSGIIVGRVLSTNGTAGTYEVLLDGRMAAWSTTSGGGPTKYTGAFTSTTAVSVPGDTHGLGTCDLAITIYNNASPARNVEPDDWTCDGTTKDVYVTFLSPQSGRYVIQ